MRVAHRVDVPSAAMHRGVDGPPGFIHGALAPVASEDAAIAGAGGVGRVGEQHHVGGAQQAEVHRERVHPKEGRVFRVAQGDVSAHAFGVAVAGPVPEEGGHVGEGPEAMSGEGGVGGDAWGG